MEYLSAKSSPNLADSRSRTAPCPTTAHLYLPNPSTLHHLVLVPPSAVFFCQTIPTTINDVGVETRRVQKSVCTTNRSFRRVRTIHLVILTYRDTFSSTEKLHDSNGVVSRSVTPIPSRPTTPRPPGEPATFKTGMLTIVIFSGEFTPRPSSGERQFNGFLPVRSRIVATTRRNCTRCHPESACCSTRATIEEQSRKYATKTLLVVTLCRVGIRQERDLG